MAGPSAGSRTIRRVLLVDDHAAFRASAGAWLSHEGQLVVGTCASGEEALSACADLGPDVVLLDLNLPGISGVEVARALAELADAPDVVIISSDTEAGSDVLVRTAPVVGFIAKEDLTWAAIESLLG